MQLLTERTMNKIFFTIVLSLFAVGAFAQASAPAAAASAPKHKWLKKLKNHRPASAAVNPETSPDKKGGN
jgi:hypothetical protein